MVDSRIESEQVAKHFGVSGRPKHHTTYTPI